MKYLALLALASAGFAADSTPLDPALAAKVYRAQAQAVAAQWQAEKAAAAAKEATEKRDAVVKEAQAACAAINATLTEDADGLACKAKEENPKENQ
jgi:UDP-N-acetylmuramate-alanine ligase